MPLRRVAPLWFVSIVACLAGVLDARAQDGAPTAGAASEEQPIADCEILARVNSEVILACELDWQVRLMFEQRFGPGAAAVAATSPQFAGAREMLIKQLLVSQIEVALLYGDFRSNAPMADLNAIHASLEPMFEEREAKRLMEVLQVEERGQLDAKLRELGTSVGERKQEFFRTMISSSWLQQAIDYDKEVTHDQMLTHYRENVAEYERPASARWEELMVRFDKHGTKADAWAAIARLGNRAAPVVARAGSAPAFAEVAPTGSDGFTAEEGGAYDWTVRGSLAAEAVETAVFNQPVGVMSPILEGPLGFHIVRVLERREAGPQPFREVQADIRKALREERHSAAVNAKVTELKKNARLWTAFTGPLTYEELAQLNGPPAGGTVTR